MIKLIKMIMEKVICSVGIQNDISPQFESRNGLGQRDALAYLRFNIVLEKTVKGAKLDNRGTIF